MGEPLPLDVISLETQLFHTYPGNEKGRWAYKIFVPEIFGIVLVSFVSCMPKDGFDLIVLFLLRIGVYVIAWVRLVVLFEVLDIISIVGYSDTSA
jgi:hypothetical protein